MSRNKTNDETTEVKNEAVETTTETITKKGVEPMANKTGKMGVVKYLNLYPQSTYIAALLKSKYPTAVKTKTEWDQIVTDLLNQKVNG